MSHSGPRKKPAPQSVDWYWSLGKTSKEFRQAASEGKLSEIKKLMPELRAKDEEKLEIDLKVAFDEAAHGGHLEVVKYLYNFIHPKTLLMSGLYEAARNGRIFTVRWLLSLPDFEFENWAKMTIEQNPLIIGGIINKHQQTEKLKALWKDAMTAAVKVAASNQHWGTMLELMSKTKTHIQERQANKKNVDGCELSGCDEYEETKDLLRLFSEMRCTEVYIPSSSGIPKALFDKESIENELGKSKPKVKRR